MGVSKKWVKALLGLRRSDKSPTSEKDDNVGGNVLASILVDLLFLLSFLVENL